MGVLFQPMRGFSIHGWRKILILAEDDRLLDFSCDDNDGQDRNQSDERYQEKVPGVAEVEVVFKIIGTRMDSPLLWYN